MTTLYLPPGVTRELYDERLKREAQAHASGVFVRDERCREFDPLLFRVEPYLSMVFCREPAPLPVVACGARPGRYNIVRQVPGTPVTFLPVVGPDGEYVEPSSRVFQMLDELDSWKPSVKRDRQQRSDRIADARAKAEVDERARMDQEVWERWQAVSRTQVSMNTDTPWAQNHAGHKRVRGEKRK